MAKTEVVFGIHSVQALLKSAPHRITAIKLLRGRQDQRIQKIVNAAEANKISLKYVDRKSLDQACEGNHQGVIALASPGKTYDEKFLYDLISGGAADSVPLIPVTNLARTLKKLQEAGVWVAGAAGEAENTVYETDLRGSRAIVMGAEGAGMRRLTRECCDDLIKIPMLGVVNVSVATGVVLFEVRRQRAESSAL